jgi:PBP4 family serine-type D-alanyl-D-alanine carboxypeptidase
VGVPRPALLLPALLLPALLLCGPARPALAARPQAAPSAAVLRAFEARVDEVLAWAGLDAERAGLLLYSTREGRYLAQRNIHRPYIPASNAKLVTTYAAMRVLAPDHRWRTRFHRVEEHDDARGGMRQGLLVEAGGDPTLTAADLQRVAWVLRSHGIDRLDAGLFFDGGLFDDVIFPASWGDVSRAQPWFAPVSPFIVEHNVIEFLIATRAGGTGFNVYTRTPGFRIVSALEPVHGEQPAIRVEQAWQDDTATFTVAGSLAPARQPYHLAAAVERPLVHFYQQLRESLRLAGIQGEMPLRRGPAPARREHLHTELSPPLPEVLVDVNKNSSNLGAEVLLRTMGLSERDAGVSAADGLAVLRRAIARDFPEAAAELRQVDGSGLSRENRLSPLLVVRLLNRVRQDFALRPEFVNSLSVALTDGTLQYRDYPWRLRGRLRAKTGSLAGVSSISGYLRLERDVVVFAFLVNEPGRPTLELQEAQDRALVGLFDALLAREADDLAPLLPGAGQPPASDAAEPAAPRAGAPHSPPAPPPRDTAPPAPKVIPGPRVR